LTLKMTGAGGVPASGVSGVVLNVTVTDTTAASFLTVWPAGSSRPLASNLNWVAGQTIPNLVMAKLGVNDSISIFNNRGGAAVVADVVGYCGPAGGSPPGPTMISLPPARLLDPRTGTGGFFAPLHPGGSLALHVLGVGGVPASGVTAVILNVTVTDTTNSS